MRCPNLSELPKPSRGKKGWTWTEESSQLPENMPNGQPWPKISIVTPSYNQGQFIEETIRSVLLQGYPNLEYIIVDGASTDNSVETIKKYEKWLTHWVSERDRGQSHAINKGFSSASGEIYGWLNSDDYFLKDALHNIAMAYDASPEAGAWCGASLYISEHGKKISVRQPDHLDLESIAKWNEHSFGQPACFFSKKAWQECGSLDEDLQYGMDFDLWIKIAKRFSFQKVEAMLAIERVHQNAKTQRDQGLMYAVQCQIQIRHGYEQFVLEDIREWMNGYLGLTRKIERISRLPFLRPIMPIVRIVWKKVF